MKRILKCEACERYTMKEICSCGGKAVITIPPKYVPGDKYADYRRKAKRAQLEAKGLL
ncbi:MAG: nucleolar RNA-binding Nop10p family protein [Candidatus Woesearchaeota archaeon]